MPRLEEWEIKKYWEIFQGLKPENKKLTGDKVSPVLKNSRLKDAQLSQIWDLADVDSDGKLDFEEFCITMRLIFDLVNGKSTDVPTELPSWLIPQSKAHLIHANKAVASGSNNNSGYSSSDVDEELALSDDFDWYISPTDKATYETIYNSNSDQYGRVRFESLEELYQTLRKVPRSDISSAWNLVNPKSFETIDKDQVLILLHILNQRENGKRVPRGVPASLRATFSKEVPSYDLSAPNKTITEPSANDKKAFGTSYLTKIGQGNQPQKKGTDFSVTEGTDWEEVRLRRELTDLEKALDRAQNEASSSSADESALLKHEFQQLLKYKQEELASSQNRGDGASITDLKNDVGLISSQVQILEEFLAEKERDLANLRQQLSSES